MPKVTKLICIRNRIRSQVYWSPKSVLLIPSVTSPLVSVRKDAGNAFWNKDLLPRGTLVSSHAIFLDL